MDKPTLKWILSMLEPYMIYSTTGEQVHLPAAGPKSHREWRGIGSAAPNVQALYMIL